MSSYVSLASLFEKENDVVSNQPIIKVDNEDKDSIKCLHDFGYLAKQFKGTSFPEECLLCSKVVDCIVHL